jgi:glutathione peroxidase
MRCRFALLASSCSFLIGGVGLVGCSGESASDPGPSPSGASSAAGNESDQKGVPKDTQADPSENAPSETKVSGVVNATCTPGEAGSLYALKVKALGGSSEIPMCAYEGTVVLIVNGASGCGYTPQYKPLEALYTKYKETRNEKFEVLAFPSDSFNQEKDSDQAVSEFCTTEYAITFPLTTIGPVIDDATKNVTAQPVYKWLYAQPGYEKPVSWNFEKFLISKQGKIVKRWLSATSPDEGGEIDLAIAAELAK